MGFSSTLQVVVKLATKLVVGLGNPGKKYQKTRHNVGFDVLGEVAKQYGTTTPKSRFQGELVEAMVGTQRVFLLAPHTYMNRSGSSVRAAFDFYKFECEDLLVVCDDFNLPLARMRFRAKGSAGGQKGLNDIIRHLGTQELSRLRIGIGAAPDHWDIADYVLSRFTDEEAPEVKHVVKEAAQAIADWAAEGIGYCMNKYNSNG